MEFTKEQQLYAEIVQKAWEDADFKASLVANPVATIEEFTGQKLNLPEGKTLIVRDQTAEDTVYINIPAQQEVDAELSENQLEAVSGGTGRCGTEVPGSTNPKVLPIGSDFGEPEGGIGIIQVNPFPNIFK